MKRLSKCTLIVCVAMLALASTSTAQQSASAKASKGTISYSGYSEKYMPVNKLVAENQIGEACVMNSKIFKMEGESSKCTEPLAYLEGAILELNAGNSDSAVEKFAIAEELFAIQESKTKAGGAAKSGAFFAAESILGKEDLKNYTGEGFEKVMMLNFKSIAYLLSGKREAYNVTRRAINWQDVERRRFEDKIQKLNEEKAKEQQNGTAKGIDLSSLNISSMLAAEYAPMEKKAQSIPSAFVNPFSYYVAGIIQEFESYDDKNLRDNALISYKKALELNPGSTALKNAVQNASASPPANTRLVHVVAGVGFVPEKKILQMALKQKDMDVPVKLPIYVPQTSQVHRIDVLTGNKKKLASLSTVADIEAICLRNQKDNSIMRDLRLMLAIMRQSMEQAMLKDTGEIGKWISKKRDDMTTPDTRSWMGLPATMQAARFYVPANLDKIIVTTYDARGKQLASSTVMLDTMSNNFVYIRSIDKTMYAQSNTKLWLAGK
jgi:uncharacterized protein